MDAAAELRTARRRAGQTQRELARAAGTSQATIAAYESGAKTPGVDTLSRLLAAAGCRLTVVPDRRSPAELELAGQRLVQVLELAEALPFSRPGPLAFPRLPS